MKYYIIGNGGFAKEVLFLCKQVFGSDNDFCGFIDYKPTELNVTYLGKTYPVIDEDTFLLQIKNCTIFIGLGSPNNILKVSQKFKGFSFPNLIHPNVIMDKSVKLGYGNIIAAGSIFTVDIDLGNFNVVNLNVTIGHDTKVGDFNVFNPASNISGSVNIGSCNLFGTNSTILQGINIGNNSIIGASSLINRNVDSNLVVVGVPAKVIKQIS